MAKRVKLNPKQKKFAHEYIRTANAYQSAITAGYSEKYAKNAKAKMVDSGGKIKEYIDQLLSDMNKKEIADTEEVLLYFSRLLKGELTESDQLVTPTGEVVDIERPAAIRDRTRAAENLAKIYSMYDKQSGEEEDEVIIVEDLEEMDRWLNGEGS